MQGRSEDLAQLRGHFEGAQASGVIVDVACDDELVRLMGVDERLQTARDGF